MLLRPKLAPKFLSKNQIFSLTEYDSPSLYYYRNEVEAVDYLSPNSTGSLGCFKFEDPKVGESYMEDAELFIVTDDLTVKPFHVASSLSSLKGMNISLSDVVNLDVEIGLEEGLSILKASLTSTSALTKGLIPFLMKQPKEEH